MELGSGPGGKESHEEAASPRLYTSFFLTPFPDASRDFLDLACRLYSSSSESWNHRQSSQRLQISYSVVSDPRDDMDDRSPACIRGTMVIPKA
jgi:hypothetical protein